MSRIGRLPVAVPSGVKVDLQGSRVFVTGPKGEMERDFSPDISISMENGAINVTRHSDEGRYRALHGTTRALIHNMVVGVSAGLIGCGGGGGTRSVTTKGGLVFHFHASRALR